MKKPNTIRTEGDRHPYIKRGYYWRSFGHLWDNATDAFRKRMIEQKEEDEKNTGKRSLSVPGSHYPYHR